MEFPFKAVAFDWAHTLVDLGEEDDRAPLEKVFAFLKIKQIPLPDFEDCLKKSRELFKSMIELSRTTHREARYEEVYQERKVFPEVPAVLKQLNQWGISMGIVSNTTNPVAMKAFELEGSGLKEYFDFTIYSSGLPFRKPHPSIFQLAISRFQVQPSQILFVGDSLSTDIFGAHEVGMKTAWLNRKKEQAELCPDYELGSLEDLLRIHWVHV